MSKLQYTLIGATTALFLVLYFACETKAPGHQQIEKARSARQEVLDVSNLIRSAHDRLPPEQVSTLIALEQELEKAVEDSAKVELLQRISGAWYGNGELAIAGHYAQEIAEKELTEEAWAIAATTFSICVQRSADPDQRAFCNQRAVQAFESAISLNPEEVSHKVNLALTYTEMPPQDNPMKGVLMLRELQQNYPESPLVLNSLGRLAIQTGQYERALERLQQALAIDPDNRSTNCLLAQAYSALGNEQQALTYEALCKNSQ